MHRGPRGPYNGNYKHGRYTTEAIEQRRELNAWVREMAKVAQEVG